MPRIPRAHPKSFSKMVSQDKNFVRNLFSDHWELSRTAVLAIIASIVLFCVGLILLY